MSSGLLQVFVKVPEFDKHPKKAGGHIGRNVVEITIKMKTIVRKTLMIEIFISIFISILIFFLCVFFSFYSPDSVAPLFIGGHNSLFVCLFFVFSFLFFCFCFCFLIKPLKIQTHRKIRNSN